MIVFAMFCVKTFFSICHSKTNSDSNVCPNSSRGLSFNDSMNSTSMLKDPHSHKIYLCNRFETKWLLHLYITEVQTIMDQSSDLKLCWRSAQTLHQLSWTSLDLLIVSMTKLTKVFHLIIENCNNLSEIIVSERRIT